MIVVGIIAWILHPFFSGAWYSHDAQRELVAFTSKLTPGMSQDDVRARFASARRELLTIREFDATLMFVETPRMFGAGEWRAWLDFRSGRLSSIRIRTMDGVHIKPDGSPPDVGTPPPAPRR
jgi:hypothetical protein